MSYNIHFDPKPESLEEALGVSIDRYRELMSLVSATYQRIAAIHGRDNSCQCLGCARTALMEATTEVANSCAENETEIALLYTKAGIALGESNPRRPEVTVIELQTPTDTDDKPCLN